MNQLQKWGGVAALYEALAYVIGIIGFLMVVNISEITDPLQKVAAIADNQGLLTLLHLIVYVVWGAVLVVLALALHDRLDGENSAVVRAATAFGLIWAGLVIASGMIYNIGMDTVAGMFAADPAQAATVWLAVEAVFTGLGGGVEVVGGLWVLLLSVAALRSGALPRLLNYLGLLVSAAGLATVVPALGEIGGMVFGLTQIVWFAWLGIALLRGRPEAAASAAPVDSRVSPTHPLA
ncbi:MAG: hypothetical protein Kow0031_10180 [Anaerolineae bacterium]